MVLRCCLQGNMLSLIWVKLQPMLGVLSQGSVAYEADHLCSINSTMYYPSNTGRPRPGITWGYDVVYGLSPQPLCEVAHPPFLGWRNHSFQISWDWPIFRHFALLSASIHNCLSTICSIFGLEKNSHSTQRHIISYMPYAWDAEYPGISPFGKSNWTLQKKKGKVTKQAIS